MAECLAEGQEAFHRALIKHLRQVKAELGQPTDPESAASFLETTMYGFQIAARAGMPREALRDMVKYAVRSVKR